eukprot:GHVR01014126.1.p1 GENE.GHVR01014126.1~~GHVR01014126.1.p1  ORF type:complete len:450 (+),score=83.04 GHVR01014126.1:79-1428(+)
MSDIPQEKPSDSSMANAMKDVYIWGEVGALGRFPSKRSLHSMCAVGVCLYVFGGYDGKDRCNDLYKYNNRNKRWLEITSPGPAPRDRHTAVGHRIYMYVFGGYDGQQRVNDLWRYDTEQEVWDVIDTSGTPPTPRHSHSACVYGESMFVFGGYDGNYRSDFYEFHFPSNSWSSVRLNCSAVTPRPRYRASLVVWRNRILLFGGHEGSHHIDEFLEYNIDRRAWSHVVVNDTGGGDKRPSARDSHVACVFADSMYLFGGSNGEARNEFYEFKIEVNDSSIAQLSTTSLDNTSMPLRGEWVLIQKHTNDPFGENSIVRKPCAKLANSLGSKEHDGSVDTHLGVGARKRFCHAAEVFEGKLFVFGGFDGTYRLGDFLSCHLRPNLHVGIPPSTLVNDLRGFVGNPMFSDMTFVVEGRVLYAHKILCFRCECVCVCVCVYLRRVCLWTIFLLS